MWFRYCDKKDALEDTHKRMDIDLIRYQIVHMPLAVIALNNLHSFELKFSSHFPLFFFFCLELMFHHLVSPQWICNHLQGIDIDRYSLQLRNNWILFTYLYFILDFRSCHLLHISQLIVQKYNNKKTNYEKYPYIYHWISIKEKEKPFTIFFNYNETFP